MLRSCAPTMASSTVPTATSCCLGLKAMQMGASSSSTAHAWERRGRTGQGGGLGGRQRRQAGGGAGGGAAQTASLALRLRQRLACVTDHTAGSAGRACLRQAGSSVPLIGKIGRALVIAAHGCTRAIVRLRNSHSGGALHVASA